MVDEAHVKQIVEAIAGHQIDSEHAIGVDDFGAVSGAEREITQLEKELAAQGITMEEDAEDSELFHIRKDGEDWLVFSICDWAWKEYNGIWPWQESWHTITLYEG